MGWDWGWFTSSSATKALEVPTAPAPAPSSPPTPTAIQSPEVPERTPEEQSKREFKQMGLFLAGAGFLTASALITRRAVARKMISSFPKFYQPSHGRVAPESDKAQDTLVAIEALNLATLNVFSFGIMMTGGLAWAFDISSLDDLRRKARKTLYGTNGAVDQAAEQQVEEWIAEVLSKKEKREKAEESSRSKDR